MFVYIILIFYISYASIQFERMILPGALYVLGAVSDIVKNSILSVDAAEFVPKAFVSVSILLFNYQFLLLRSYFSYLNKCIPSLALCREVLFRIAYI
jgi:hypothetical protein